MLFSIFLALTIFGGTVTLIDLISGLGHQGGDSDGGDGDSHNGGPEADHDPGTHLLTPDQNHFDGSLRVRDKDPGHVLYRVVSLLRRTVYFSLGAGAAGLAAILTGSGEIVSFLWAGGTGAASLGILSMVKNLQLSELDSTVSEEELLYEEGEVVVTILPGQIGKIRMKGKGSMIERYAKAMDPLRTFNKGDQIKVSEVKEDMLMVVLPEQEQER